MVLLESGDFVFEMLLNSEKLSFCWEFRNPPPPAGGGCRDSLQKYLREPLVSSQPPSCFLILVQDTIENINN